MHGIYKGTDPNIRPEKQVIKPVISPESKGVSQAKPRLGQGRAGIKWRTFKFPMSQPHDKPEQPKLLPHRRPIIQIVDRLPLQQSQNINQPKTRLKVSIPESSIIPESLGHHDKVIPVPDYTIPQTMSECNSIFRTIRRKGVQDTRREIPAYAEPIFRPPPKPMEIPLQVIPRKHVDSDFDTLEKIWRKFPISRRCDVRNVPKAWKIIFSGPTRIARSSEYSQISANICTKIGWYTQTIKDNTKIISKGNSFTCNCKGNTDRILNQLIF